MNDSRLALEGSSVERFPFRTSRACSSVGHVGHIPTYNEGSLQTEVLNLFIQARSGRLLLPKFFKQMAIHTMQISEVDHLFHAVNMLSLIHI